MKIKYENGDARLSDFDSFCLSQTLECGQCFRFEKLGQEDYRIVAFERILRLKAEEKEIIFFDTTKEEMEQIWIPYFDLDRDYQEIRRMLSASDSVLAEAAAFAPGIRILKQDFFECFISFILSQNNRISKIRTSMQMISQKFGVCLEEKSETYAFPDYKTLAEATEEVFWECKAGFRAPYLLDAVRKVADGTITEEKLRKMDTQQARECLMQVKGIGPKVADCILLFSLGRVEVFPTDVWIKKVMSHFYFNGEETSIKEIQKKANQLYGKNGGFAQQYLFHYARSLKIGEKMKK